MIENPRFPRLTDGQLKTITPFGKVIEYKSDKNLFEVGDRHLDMQMVMEGSIEIWDPNNNNIVIAHDRGVSLPGTTACGK